MRGLLSKKKWYGANQDKVRDYVSKNKDAIASRMKSWREANAESIEEYNLEWREKNRTHIQKYSQDYHSGNPQVKRVSENKRRAQKRRSKGAFSWEDVERLYILQVGMCVYCEADLSDKFEIDHITPLSRGGDNSAENIQLTSPPCNRGKHAKTHDEYLEFLKRRRVSN